MGGVSRGEEEEDFGGRILVEIGNVGWRSCYYLWWGVSPFGELGLLFAKKSSD